MDGSATPSEGVQYGYGEETDELLQNGGMGMGMGMDGEMGMMDQGYDDGMSTAAGTSELGHMQNNSKKRKITRKRPLRSCLTCNKRKIKCDRLDKGTGGCTPCMKRGEGDSCSLVSGDNHPFQSTASILFRLDQLESRVEELESTSQASQQPSPPGANAATNGFIDSRNQPQQQQQRIPESAATPQPVNMANTSLNASSGPSSRATPNSSLVGIQAGVPIPQDAIGTSSLNPKFAGDRTGPPCDTEEAALVLESLYASKGSKQASTYPTPSSIAGSPDDRSRKSTILVNPESGGSSYSAQRSREIRMRILRSPTFPSRELADHLIATYFRLLDVYWHVHINYLFEEEYHVFWQMLQSGRHLEVDPAWLALLLMTLALALQVAQLPLPPSIADQNQGPEEVLQLSDVWSDDAQEMLKAADWSTKPQFRTIQTLILLNGYQTMSALKDPSGVTWNAAAVRIAQQLGLHNLSADPKMPEDDPAVPTGSNHVKMQLGRRLWLSVVVLEHVYALRLGLNLPLASTPFESILPANVDDIDLQVKGPLQEKPSWKSTNTTSVLHRWILGRTHRELLELPSDMPAHEKYTHVLTLDAELRKYISDAPSASEPLRGDVEAYKSAVWLQWAAISELHGELLHIHRPYMTRGYTDERYAYSVKVCLESVKVICEAWQHLKDSIVDERFWWSSMRWLSAAIVIFIDLYHAIDAGCTNDILEMKKAEIPGIYEIFQARQRSIYPTTMMFAYSATKVVDNLLEAEKLKRSAAVSRRNSVDGSAGQAEPVGMVFQRIAQSMSRPESAANKATSSTPQAQLAPLKTSHRAEQQQISTPLSGMPTMQQMQASHRGSIAHMHLQQRSGSNSAGLHYDTSSPLQPGQSPAYSQQVSPSVPQHPQHTGLSDGHLQYQPFMVQDQLYAQPAPQAPISWDTAHFFHPDPSTLLHSMGYSVSAPQPQHHQVQLPPVDTEASTSRQGFIYAGNRNILSEDQGYTGADQAWYGGFQNQQ